jgi:hypothetical protein
MSSITDEEFEESVDKLEDSGKISLEKRRVIMSWFE